MKKECRKYNLNDFLFDQKRVYSALSKEKESYELLDPFSEEELAQELKNTLRHFNTSLEKYLQEGFTLTDKSKLEENEEEYIINGKIILSRLCQEYIPQKYGPERKISPSKIVFESNFQSWKELDAVYFAFKRFVDGRIKTKLEQKLFEERKKEIFQDLISK